MKTHDVVIRGGTIVDGSGRARFRADVAIQGRRISAIGRVPEAGRQEIDAHGHVVTPGFVDVHTHYDGQITWENRLQPSSGHGVTTVVMGNCGVGFAPTRRTDRELVVRLMEGVEDIPAVVMAEGIPWSWETFGEYLDLLATRTSDVDFAAQFPHSPLRVYVMGERGAALEPPTADDLAQMRRLTREAIAAGALGVTTSRNLAHRFRDGRLAPSVATEEAELLAIAQGLGDAGRGVFQLLPNSERDARDEFALMRRIVDVSRRPLSFSLLQGTATPTNFDAYGDELERAAAEGCPIRGQIYPRPVGILMGLDLSYHPLSLNPSFQPLQDLPLAEKVARMRDPELRARLLAEQPDDPNPFFVSVVNRQELLFRLGDPPDYSPSAEHSIACMARARGIEPKELIYDSLLENEGRAILYAPSVMPQEAVERAANMLRRPGVMLGLGDGGAHYGMICDAAYPSYILTEWLRHGRLTLERAVQAMTGDCAAAVGLSDRGQLVPGAKADLNILDLDRLRLHAPRVQADLPASGKRLTQRADGYVLTMVSGQITYRDGVPTGALPGRLVRPR